MNHNLEGRVLGESALQCTPGDARDRACLGNTGLEEAWLLNSRELIFSGGILGKNQERMVGGEGGEGENELLNALQGTPESLHCAELEAWCLRRDSRKAEFLGSLQYPS